MLLPFGGIIKLCGKRLNFFPLPFSPPSIPSVCVFGNATRRKNFSFFFFVVCYIITIITSFFSVHRNFCIFFFIIICCVFLKTLTWLFFFLIYHFSFFSLFFSFEEFFHFLFIFLAFSFLFHSFDCCVCFLFFLNDEMIIVTLSFTSPLFHHHDWGWFMNDGMFLCLFSTPEFFMLLVIPSFYNENDCCISFHPLITLFCVLTLCSFGSSLSACVHFWLFDVCIGFFFCSRINRLFFSLALSLK